MTYDHRLLLSLEDDRPIPPPPPRPWGRIWRRWLIQYRSALRHRVDEPAAWASELMRRDAAMKETM